jgi:hypothetical protein
MTEDERPGDIIFLSSAQESGDHHRFDEPITYTPPTALDAGVTSQLLHYDATTSLCTFVDPDAVAMVTRLETNVPHVQNDSRREFTKSERARQRKAASEAPRSGKRWFNMASSEVDERARNDVAALDLRQFADPSRNYKSEAKRIAGSRFFQLGTVVESKAEFYSSRLKRKERKSSLADELLDNRATRQLIKHRHEQFQATLPNQKRQRMGKKK